MAFQPIPGAPAEQWLTCGSTQPTTPVRTCSHSRRTPHACWRDHSRTGGPFLLSELPFRLLRNRRRSRAIRDRFITHVNTAVAKEGWYDRRGRRVLSRLRLLTFSGTLAAFPLGFLID